MDREGRSFLLVKGAQALVMDSGLAELDVIAHNLDDIRRRPNFVHFSHKFQYVSASVCQVVSQYFSRSVLQTLACHSERSEESRFVPRKTQSEILRCAQNDKPTGLLVRTETLKN